MTQGRGVSSLVPGLEEHSGSIGCGRRAASRSMTSRALPAVQGTVVFGEADFHAEEAAEFFLGEELSFGAVGEDAALAHHDDAVDLGDDVGEVVGDHEDADALGGNAAQRGAQLALGGEVKGVRRLVEEEHLRAVDEGAGDHDAALLAGGHLSDQLVRQMLGLHDGDGFARAVAHVRLDVEIGPERGGGEEAGNDRVEAGGDGGAFAGQFGGDNAEMAAQLGDIPALAAQQEQLGPGCNDGP